MYSILGENCTFIIIAHKNVISLCPYQGFCVILCQFANCRFTLGNWIGNGSSGSRDVSGDKKKNPATIPWPTHVSAKCCAIPAGGPEAHLRAPGEVQGPDSSQPELNGTNRTHITRYDSNFFIVSSSFSILFSRPNLIPSNLHYILL